MRPIIAADLMNPQLLTVREEMTVRELAAFLLRNQITGAPVEDAAGRLVGVVSVVDIAEAAVGAAESGEGGDEREGPGEPAARSAPEFFAQDWEEQPTVEDLEEMDELGLDGGDLRVADIMTPAIYSVDEDATVSEVASKLLGSHVHRLLVTREGKAVGIVTTSDLLGLLVDEKEG